MGRTPGFTLVLFFLCAALTFAASAQTGSANTTTITTVTTTPITGAPVTSGALPLPAPPSAALPGSGTPVGAPPDLSVNNAATGGSGAIVQPGAVVVGGQTYVNAPPMVTTPIAEPMNVPGPEAAPTGESAPTASEATQPTAPVVSRVFIGSGKVNAATRPVSLGEVAAQLRGRKPLQKNKFDNSDIVVLSQRTPSGLRPQSEDLPQGDQPVQAAPQQQPKPKKPSAAKPPQPQAQNQPNNGALDQNDLQAVEAAVKRSKEQQNKPK
jgi:hypothetical protein